MRLTRRGRALYAVLALLQVYLLIGSLTRADWVGVALAGALLVLCGLPALRGRDPLVVRAPGRVHGAARWLFRPEPPVGPPSTTAAGGAPAPSQPPAP